MNNKHTDNSTIGIADHQQDQVATSIGKKTYIAPSLEKLGGTKNTAGGALIGPRDGGKTS